MLAVFLAALDQNAVAPALPQIAGDLRTFEGLAWIITAYLIASTVTIPLYGRLSDLFGRRPLLGVSVGTFTLGSLLCGVAQDMGQLVAARAVQGLGAGGLVPLAYAVLGDLVPARERSRYLGYVSAMWAAASIAGPVVGGTFTDLVSWRLIFLVNLPLGALALAVVWRTVRPGTRGARVQVDVAGAVVLAGSVSLALLVASWLGGTERPATAVLVAAVAASVALGAVFLRIERRVPEPIVPLELFGDRVFATASMAMAVVGAVLFAYTIYVPVRVQGVLGGSATAAGLALIPFSLAWVVTSVASGRQVAATGRYRRFPIGGAVLILAGAVLVVTEAFGGGTAGIAAALAVTGGGMGMTFQALLVAAQNAVPPAHIGVASASNQFFRAMGGSAAVAVLGALLAGRTVAGLRDAAGARADEVPLDRVLQGEVEAAGDLAPEAVAAMASALDLVFLLVVPLGLLALALALRLPERPLGGPAR